MGLRAGPRLERVTTSSLLDLSPDRSAHRDDAADWWRNAVTYQIYPRSWADSDGNGIGDLPGITARLPYLRDLGVDAVWISPFYRSPMADAGYDVADYEDIDPLFGRLADADALIARATELGPQGHGRPRPQPHLRRARVVPGGARVGARLAGARRATSSATGRARTASCRRTTGRRCSAASAGRGSPRRTGSRVSGTCTCSTASSPTSTGRTRRCATSSSTSSGSGWTAASPASASTSPTGWSRTRPCRTGTVRCGCSTPTTRRASPTHRSTRSGTRTASTRSTRTGARSSTATTARRGSSAARRGCSPSSGSCATSGRPRCTSRSTSSSSTATGSPRSSSRRSPARWRPRPRSAHRRPGCCRTTTSCGTRPASGCPRTSPRPHGIRAEDPQPDAALGLRRARAATTLMLGLPGAAYLYQGEELGPPRRHRPPRRGAPGPGVPTDRRRAHGPRRLPDPVPVDRVRPVSGVRADSGDLVAAARRLPRPRRRPAGGCRGFDARALPPSARPAARVCVGLRFLGVDPRRGERIGRRRLPVER